MTVGASSSEVAITHRGDIDGLRAVAIMSVVAYHVGAPGFGGGFAGVDVFFVISGYLITSLLVGELRERGSIDLLAFYARRARRLLPAFIRASWPSFSRGRMSSNARRRKGRT